MVSRWFIMKGYLLKITALVLVLGIVFSTGIFAAEEVPQITSEAVLLIDADTGDVLYGKNENKKMYPASTTKIMVALLALENLELDEMVTAANSALFLLPKGHTNIGIKNGEQLSVRQLLYGLMLDSAGDAANVLGERISGSVDEFIKLMNEKAIEIGMKNTSYKNASGAHDENHYTTATDMAILAREAMKNEVFRTIVATDAYEIPPTEKYDKVRYLRNTNHLVSKKRTGNYFYEYATGIKTGYTDPAKNCLVSSAEKNGLSLICVVLGATPGADGSLTQFVESKALFEYGFANYTMKNVIKTGERIAQGNIESAKGEEVVIMEADSEISLLCKIDQELVVVKKGEKPEGEIKENTIVVEYEQIINEEIKAPVTKGTVLGTSKYYVGEKLIGEVGLVATKDYAFDGVKNALNTVKRVVISPFLWLPIVLFFVALVIIRQYNYNRRKKQRSLARKAQREKDAELRRAAMKKEESVEEFLNR